MRRKPPLLVQWFSGSVPANPLGSTPGKPAKQQAAGQEREPRYETAVHHQLKRARHRDTHQADEEEKYCYTVLESWNLFSAAERLSLVLLSSSFIPYRLAPRVSSKQATALSIRCTVRLVLDSYFLFGVCACACVCCPSHNSGDIAWATPEPQYLLLHSQKYSSQSTPPTSHCTNHPCLLSHSPV